MKAVLSFSHSGKPEVLGSQVIGVLAVAAWAMGLGFVVFLSLKYTIGVRVSKRVEEEGLDVYEHGESAYNYSGNTMKDYYC